MLLCPSGRGPFFLLSEQNDSERSRSEVELPNHLRAACVPEENMIMLTSRTTFLLSCALFLFPLPILAAFPVTDLTPEQLQQQEWDTECRAMLPYGQGDLEAALLFKLRDCINSKQDAQRIENDRLQQLSRLSKRDARETSRRAEVLKRISGAATRMEKAFSVRTGQGIPLERNIRSYQRIHARIRPGASTTGN